jgi:hypothetical protein
VAAIEIEMQIAYFHLPPVWVGRTLRIGFQGYWEDREQCALRLHEGAYKPAGLISLGVHGICNM